MAERTSFRVVPISTKNTITKTIKHNERKEGDRTGKHINPNLSKYNKCLYGAKECDLWKDLVEAVSEKRVDEEQWVDVKDTIYKNDLRFSNGDKIRKDAVLAAEIEVHYPGEVVTDENGVSRATDPEKFKAWEDLTVQFILDRFGGDTGRNVKQIVEHNDESGKPHLHAVFIPMYTNKNGQQRLNYHKYVDGPKDTARIQTEYAKYVEDLGFDRGVVGSRSFNNLRHSRELMTQSVGVELPQTERGETAEQYRERVNPEYEKVLVQRDTFEMYNKQMRSEKDISAKKDKQISELEENLATNQNALYAAEQEIRRLQLELMNEKREKELSRIGMQLYEDQEMIDKLYLPMQKQFADLGQQYAIDHGLVLDGSDHEIQLEGPEQSKE